MSCPEPGMEYPGNQCAALLDLVEREMRRSVSAALDQLCSGLAKMRRECSAEAWSKAVAVAREHPVREILHNDPFILRSYSKPRGYAGDGPTLDFILRARALAVRPKDRVAEIHHYMTQGPLARALRFRRDYIARVIDDAANRAPRPIRVLAAGAGHLRELDRQHAAANGKIARFVAFDPDDANLETIRRDYAALPVVTHHGSTRSLVEGKHFFEDMDIVYSAGLLETLPQAPAQALARSLFAMLKPGGSLLLTNFLPALPEAAMMEVFMDWRLVQRTQAEIYELVRPLEGEAVSGWFYSESPEETVAFVSVNRR